LSIKRSQPASTRTGPLRSIRFQISLVLLLSALNGIVLVALASVFFPDTEEESGDLAVQVALLMEELAEIQQGVLADEIEQAEQDERLDSVQQTVGSLGDGALEVGYALKDYRWTLSARRAEEQDGGGDEDLRRAHFRLLGSLTVLQREHEPSPPPLDVLGVLLAWVVVTTLATLLVAFTLRRSLAQPLQDLALAAGRVGDGDLASPFPSPTGGAEFRELAHALESMRASLVAGIEERDGQNAVQSAMLQALNDGVIFLDAEERVLGFNPAAREIVASRDVVLEEGIALVTAIPGLPEVPLYAWANEKQRLDYSDHGVVQNLTVFAQPVSDVSRALRSAWVVVVRDVTRSVEVEGVKRDFMSVVTHELKTPLTVIDGYIKLLRRGKGGELTERQGDLLGRAGDQVEVLTRMVQDLLDASRLEGGNLTLDLSKGVDAGAAVEEALQNHTGDAEQHGVALSCEVGPGARVHVRADPFRLQQVLGNLVRNALKFSDEGGRVELSAQALEEEVALRVQDHGRGIPTSALGCLFDKFYQVQQGDTRKAGGAGLGLYICDQLVRAMGGRMEVTSTVGGGSCFSAILPVAETLEVRT